MTLKQAKAWEHRLYLATYPRSGNHWMRYLIEEATGIATSSVYRDPDPMHLAQIFPWGGYCCEGGYEGNARYPMAGEMAVIKTHDPALPPQQFDRLPSEQVLRIVRNPVDSIYSWYVYEQNVFHQSIEDFLPREMLLRGIRTWSRFQTHWDCQEGVVTIYYEDLYQDPARYLKIALDATGYAYTDEDVQRAVAKYPPQGGVNKHAAHYHAEDLEYLRQQLGDLMLLHGYQ